MINPFTTRTEVCATNIDPVQSAYLRRLTRCYTADWTTQYFVVIDMSKQIDFNLFQKGKLGKSIFENSAFKGLNKTRVKKQRSSVHLS